MFPVAHTTIALVFNRLVLKDRRTAPTLIGALVPDIIDKSLAWVVRVADDSHHIGHSLAATGAVSMIAASLYSARTGRAVASSYFLHLLADELVHSNVPWLLPFSNFRRRKTPHSLFEWRGLWIGLALEVAAVAMLGLSCKRRTR